MRKSNKAITLITLIITIIVLLILAGVTINMVFGENGLINKSKTSVAKYENAQEKENTALVGYENEMNSYINGDRDEFIEYSINEKEVGTWINNKKIYEKVINIMGMTLDLSTEGSGGKGGRLILQDNVDALIDYKGYFDLATKNNYSIGLSVPSSAYNSLGQLVISSRCCVDNNKINLAISCPYADCWDINGKYNMINGFIIIRYTKTN